MTRPMLPCGSSPKEATTSPQRPCLTQLVHCSTVVLLYCSTVVLLYCCTYLRSFQHQQLKQLDVIVLWPAPLLVVVPVSGSEMESNVHYKYKQDWGGGRIGAHGDSRVE